MKTILNTLALGLLLSSPCLAEEKPAKKPDPKPETGFEKYVAAFDDKPQEISSKEMWLIKNARKYMKVKTGRESDKRALLMLKGMVEKRFKGKKPLYSLVVMIEELRAKRNFEKGVLPELEKLSKTNLKGETHNLLEILKNKKPEQRVMLALWASWCKPCVHEIPYLNHVAKTRDDVVVVSIAGDSKENVKKLLRKLPEKPAYPIYIDNERDSLVKAFQFEMIPKVVLIDADLTKIEKYLYLGSKTPHVKTTKEIKDNPLIKHL